MVGHHTVDQSFVFIPSLALEDAKWSRGESSRPARAHKVRVVFDVHA